MAEGPLVRELKARLVACGAYVEKNHGNRFQHRGRPDLEGCLNGRFFAIEVKVWPNKLTPIQRYALGEIRKARGIACVVYSMPELEEYFLKVWPSVHCCDICFRLLSWDASGASFVCPECSMSVVRG